MKLDAFGKMVREIRLARGLLLYDMAKDLRISSAELSAIECGRKPIPIWFVSKLQEEYLLHRNDVEMLRNAAAERR